jgi:ABC-type uncharacterized transport system involved in gliding motility auxiliary subunit
MKNILTIFNREIKAYFNSPIAYIFIIVFIFISTGLFMTQFFLVSIADMRMFFIYIPMILCAFLPAVTMRLWSEDRKGNTLELLLTFPIKTYELVLGKFMASLTFFTAALLATLPIPIMIAILGNPDAGAILCQYIGAFFIGGFFLALGILISGFCEDQIVSFILSIMACFGLYLLGTNFSAGSIDGWIPGFGSFLKNTLGVAHHFSAFARGVIDLSSVLFFAAGAAIFLLLNSFWLDTRMKPKSRTAFSTACLISAGIFVAVNAIFGDVAMGRFDLTEGKIYTVSRATAKILRGLDAPVTVKLFVSPSESMPTGFKTLERDMRDKLDEFKINSKGKFNYKVFHMEAVNVTSEGEEDSLERSIEKKGIRPFQVQSVEADEIGVKLIYSSMSIAYKDKPEDVIPRVMPQNLLDLEYTLASKIYKMTLKSRPLVALVAPYTEQQVDPQMQALLRSLGQAGSQNLRDDAYEFLPRLLEYEGYEVVRVRLTEEEPIPEGADTLIVIEPRELNDRQRFEINKFIVNGGSVFMGVQKYEFNYSAAGRGGFRISGVDKKPQVADLLEPWGLGISKGVLMDTQVDVVSLSGGKFMGIFEMTSPVKLPVQIKVVGDQINRDVSITSRLSSLFYLWGSALSINTEKLGGLGLKSKTLFTSSPESWEAEHHPGNLTNEDLAAPPRSETGRLPLAVLVEGQFPDVYEGKDVPDWPKEAEDASYEKEPEKAALSPKPGKMVLVGCAQLFRKEMFRDPSHSGFFLNSIDAITLGEDLIEVRSKMPINRVIKRVSTPAKAAWKIFVTFFVPAVLCGIGGFRIVLRRRLKTAYAKSV